MLKKRLMAICCLSLIWAASFASAQVARSVGEVIEPVGDKGRINWTSGVIKANGTAVSDISNPVQRLAMARRAAIRVARRNLLEVTKGVRIDSETTVENFMAVSDEIKTSVEGYVSGAAVVKESNLVGGEVEVVIRINLKGDFSDTVLSNYLPDAPQHVGGSSTFPGDPVFTGLVLDARGLNIRPAMAPKIIDENDREVYGPAYVGRDFAAGAGMAGYIKDLEAARENDRITDNPLLVKGIRAAGNSKTDIVIATDDAEKILTAASQMNFLQKCRVMILVD